MQTILLRLDTIINNYASIDLMQGYNYTLETHITDNYKDVDLTGVTVQLQMQKSDKKFIIQTENIIIEGNKIKAILDKDFTREDGQAKLQVVLFKDNFTFGSWVVKAKIKPSAINDNDGQSENKVTITEALDNKINEAENTKIELYNKINEAENTKIELYNKINEAENTKIELDKSIASGDVATIKGNVDKIKDVEIPKINEQLDNNTNLIGDDGTLKKFDRSIFLSQNEMFINVKDYGAKGDGVTDDSEAFNTAFNKGSHIIIPYGEYIVSNIAINNPKVIIGMTPPFAWREQDSSPTKLINNSDTDMFINSHWDNGGNSLYFENIYFIGNDTNNCIRARWDLCLSKCTFENFNKAIYDIHGGIVNKCKFWLNKVGISDLTDVKVTSCDIAKNEIGIDLSNGNSNQITDNRIEWNTISGIKHKMGAFNTINDNQFDRNNIGIDIDGATDMTIIGNRFDRSIEYHMKWRVNGATVVGNKFYARDITDQNSGIIKPDNAIKLLSCSNITFVGNDCNTKIFDSSSMEYQGGYFNEAGNYSPNIFKSKTITVYSNGYQYIPLSSLGEQSYINGWGYVFDVRVEYGDEVINPTFSVSKYNGISVSIPDKGVSSYNIIVTAKQILQPTII